MCCNGKILGCMSVETGTMIISVINAVIWALTIVGSVVGIIVANILLAPKPENFTGEFANNELYNAKIALLITNIVLGVLIVYGVINFIFGVFLCNGVSNRNVAHIKVYFIYGVVKAILELLSIIALVAITSQGIMLIVPLGIYCLFLHMVNITYKKFNSVDCNSFRHKQLVED